MMSFTELCRAFLAHSQERASHKKYKQIMAQHFTQWSEYPTFGQIEEWHQSLRSAPHQSNKALSLLKAMFTWGIRRGHVTGFNPATGVKRHQVFSRERVLTSPEIALIVNCLDMLYPKFATLLTVLLTTGCRMGEARQMRFEHVDFASGRWIQPKTKSGRPHLTYLPTQAREALKQLTVKGPYFFEGQYEHCLSRPAIDKTWQKTRGSMGLKDVRIHDFRRTFSTHLYRATKDEYLVKRCINHVNPNITAVYVRISFEEVAAAMQAQADRFFALRPTRDVQRSLFQMPSSILESEAPTILQ
jgi:integrase